MRICTLLLAVLGLFSSTVAAQTPEAKPVTTLGPKKQLAAVRVSGSIKLDGVLDEAAWQQAGVATDFIQNRPNPGPPEQHKTEVRILYDDAALYIGAVMHDVAPDSILRELSQRDNFGNTDFFGVFLDTYNDKLNGYGFFVTAAGVQADARYSPASGEDFAWNAVWTSRTLLQGTDWVAEMRIPYSAIRFSTQPEQSWGLNFMRNRQSTRQGFFWNNVKPEVDGFVNQWGLLTGIRDIKAPVRLSLTPYVSGYVNHFPYNQEGVRNSTTSFNGGADVKYGINESFTLDATLVPDFGQVISDNQVLNLTPFEVQFNENRQFFTEGTELFNKGNLFYSRRIGSQPMGLYQVEGQLQSGERIVRNPAETRLLNATKVSGRTSKGLGIGLFNAVSKEAHAEVANEATGESRRITTQPLTNYSIAVLDQSLKNNSFVSLINTNVTRGGRTYDANVTGGLLRLANKSNSYALDASLIYSRRRGKQFGQEQDVSDPDGFKYQVGVGKIGGQFQWRLSHGIESETYNISDLGIQFGNNFISQVAELNYSKFKPFWKVNRFSSYFVVENRYLFRPTLYQNLGFYHGANTTFTKNFLSLGYNLDVNLHNNDYFEPRVFPLGRYYVRVPANVGLNGWLSSDYRKKLALDFNWGYRAFARDGDRPRRLGYSLSLSPRYRVNNQLNFRYNLGWDLRSHQIGYAGVLSPDEVRGFTHLEDMRAAGDPLLGRRDVVTVNNTVSGNYTFNNRMSFTIRTRHYVSHVKYQEFIRLRPGAQEETVDYQGNRNTTFNAFNVDAFYEWWFAPGSQVSIVWKNAGSTFLRADQATPLYFDNLGSTINTPHNNSVSVRILYFLDYVDLKRKRPAGS
ncbi:DUF5916 domain-containing protein [Hymenobacter koreensis]|uniref:Carbohydrate family 9 binding domain-like n=1 Tax=Hymenobacter koreensis TaxID=1084523 RepID=A0ABP8IVK9_9BACT